MLKNPDVLIVPRECSNIPATLNSSNAYVDTNVFQKGFKNILKLGDQQSYGKSIYATNVWDNQVEDEDEIPGNFLMFSCRSGELTLSVNNQTKNWDGVLKYSVDKILWSEWNGTCTLDSKDGKLYICGEGNTHIAQQDNRPIEGRWVLDTSVEETVCCKGNIESLLDWRIVSKNQHPIMGYRCFACLFAECSKLESSPDLPSKDLAESCYSGMFDKCTNLTKLPELPAKNLEPSCYASMFRGCTAITTGPKLPAKSMKSKCYQSMFSECQNLTTMPELPATTLDESCYESMFSLCKNLVSLVDELPARLIASRCYRNMFAECSKIESSPRLPAITLAYACYEGMFFKCTRLSSPPELPATTLAERCYMNMFTYCNRLITFSELPATTLAKECYASMFTSCSNLKSIISLPAITLAESCYSNMFQFCRSLTQPVTIAATEFAPWCCGNMYGYCDNIRISEEKTGNYQQEYRIPIEGIGQISTNALTNMFANTGGTFTGTPEINKIYYVDVS